MGTTPGGKPGGGRRVVRIVIGVVAGVAGLGVLGVGALALRLSQGPMEVPWITQYIVTQGERVLGPGRLQLESTAIAWEGFRHGGAPLDLRFTGMRYADAAGHMVVVVPQSQVTLSFRRLLYGDIAPRSLRLVNFHLELRQLPDGSVVFGSNTTAARPSVPTPAASSSGAAAPAAAAAGSTADASQLPDDGEPALQPVFGALLGPVWDSPFSALRLLRLADSTVTLHLADGQEMRLDAPLLEVIRRGAVPRLQLQGQATLHTRRLTVAMPLSATAVVDAGTAQESAASPAVASAPDAEVRRWPQGRLHLTAEIPQLDPRAFAPLSPFLDAVRARPDVQVQADFSPDLRLLGARAGLHAGAGQMLLGTGAVNFSSFEVQAETDGHQLSIPSARLQVPGGGAVTLSGRAAMQAGQWQSALHIGTAAMPVAALAQLWPAGVAPAARAEVLPKLAGGQIRSLGLDAQLALPATLDQVRLGPVALTLALDRLAVDVTPQQRIQTDQIRLTMAGDGTAMHIQKLELRMPPGPFPPAPATAAVGAAPGRNDKAADKSPTAVSGAARQQPAGGEAPQDAAAASGPVLTLVGDITRMAHLPPRPTPPPLPPAAAAMAAQALPAGAPQPSPPAKPVPAKPAPALGRNAPRGAGAAPDASQDAAIAPSPTSAGWDGHVQISLDRLRFSDIDHYWPLTVAPHVREWMVTNITDGIARDGHWSLGFALPEDGARPYLTDVSGTVALEQGVVHWLRPVPPMEQVAGNASFNGPSEVVVHVDNALQDGPNGVSKIQAHDATLRFYNLDAEPALADISAHLTGPLTDAMTVLQHPRLHLFDRHKPPVQPSAGTVDAQLSLGFPMLKELTVDKLKVQVQAKVADAVVPGLLAGHDLRNGNMALQVTSQGLQGQGGGEIEGIPVKIGTEIDFRHGPSTQIVERDRLDAMPDAAQLGAFGMDLKGFAAGPIMVSARAERRRDDQFTADIQADLSQAELTIGTLNWRKAPGSAGIATATLHMQGPKLVGVDNLRLQALELALRGSAVVDADGQVHTVQIGDSYFGGSNMQGMLTLPETPGAPYHLSLYGPTLDLRSLFPARAADAPAPPPPPAPGQPAAQLPPPKPDSTPMQMDLRFDRVLLAAGHSLYGVVVQGQSDAYGVLREAAVTGRTNPTGPSVVPVAGPATGSAPAGAAPGVATPPAAAPGAAPRSNVPRSNVPGSSTPRSTTPRGTSPRGRTAPPPKNRRGAEAAPQPQPDGQAQPLPVSAPQAAAPQATSATLPAARTDRMPNPVGGTPAAQTVPPNPDQGPATMLSIATDPVPEVSMQGADGRPRPASSGPATPPVVPSLGLFTFTLKPEADKRQLSIQAEDGGALLRALNLVNVINGGRMSVTGAYASDRPGAPLTGNAELTDFSVSDAPAIGKILQGMTLYGLVDASRGPGLSFSRLVAPFTLSSQALVLNDARVFSSSLGFTAKGRVLRGDDPFLELQGTVVPAYVFNSLLGNLPIVGRLFSPEAGGGLFAMNYRVQGPLSNVSVSANPLSALTPGFLRGVFGLLDSDDTKAPPPARKPAAPAKPAPRGAAKPAEPPAR